MTPFPLWKSRLTPFSFDFTLETQQKPGVSHALFQPDVGVKISPGKLAQLSRALRRRATAAITPEAMAARA